jgi:hypothetical protein
MEEQLFEVLGNHLKLNWIYSKLGADTTGRDQTSVC